MHDQRITSTWKGNAALRAHKKHKKLLVLA